MPDKGLRKKSIVIAHPQHNKKDQTAKLKKSEILHQEQEMKLNKLVKKHNFERKIIGFFS